MSIVLDNISHSFGALDVISDLSLILEENKVTCILGPSGCGKSTLLNILSGVISHQAGTISGLKESDTAYLFQEPRLLPWKTLYKNLDLVLKNRFSEDEREEILNRMFRLVELDEFRDYFPHQLSGGMRQRASLARAFAYPASLLLMDEPFQALDPALKLNLIEDFKKLWNEDPRTSLLVTHNIQEAALLGDQIIVLSRRPSRVTYVLQNELDHEERIPYSNPVLELEHQLYTAMVTSGSDIS